MITARDVLKHYNDLPRNSPLGLTDVIEAALNQARAEGKPPTKIVIVHKRHDTEIYSNHPVDIEKINLEHAIQDKRERADDRINSIEFQKTYPHMTII